MQKTIGITLGCLLLSLLPLDAVHAARVALPRTGQTTCYSTATNAAIDCVGTIGEDGNMLKGVAWPTPRFTDNLVNGVSNGTVTDNLTGLIWLKNANCSATLGGVVNTGIGLTWANALTWTNNLVGNNTACNLNDGSTAGQWRLPSVNELESLVDISTSNPALPAGHLFGTSVQSPYYWSGSTYSSNTTVAWTVSMYDGNVSNVSKTYNLYVWPVRAGQ
jgi:hypothetical protein